MPRRLWRCFNPSSASWPMSDAAELLHVFPSFAPGGTQLRMASIINALGSSFSHHVISMDGEFGASGALDCIQLRLSSPPPKSRGLPYAFAFRNAVRGLRPAAVLTYNWGSIDAVLGARFAASCPVIHNECGFGEDESITLKRRRVWARRMILNAVFRTVVTSQTMLTIARTQYRLRPDKVQLIPTGVDVNRYQPNRNPAGRVSLGVLDEDLLLGYIGGLRPEKNLGLLLRAFHSAQLPNGKLLLVGDGPCRRELQALALNLGIADRVIFAGHQTDPARYLAMLDAFVMSSATEQVSNAQLEAMASGLPVICTDVGDSRALLGEEAQCCVVPPGDTDSYARALQNVASSAELRTALGAANRRRSVDSYSKDRMVREYGALLECALMEPRAT